MDRYAQSKTGSDRRQATNAYSKYLFGMKEAQTGLQLLSYMFKDEKFSTRDLKRIEKMIVRLRDDKQLEEDVEALISSYMQRDGWSRSASVYVDGESYMSVQGLQSLKDHAEDLLGQVGNDTPLPDWVEAKITRAAQAINDVYEYMNHGRGQNL